MSREDNSRFIAFHLRRIREFHEYEAMLQAFVFRRIPPPGENSESFQKALKKQNGYAALSMIWRASRFVKDEPTRFNRSSLAKEIVGKAASARKHNNMEEELKPIIIAAATYGLIEIDKSRPKEEPISAMPLLHELMCAYAMLSLRLDGDE